MNSYEEKFLSVEEQGATFRVGESRKFSFGTRVYNTAELFLRIQLLSLAFTESRILFVFKEMAYKEL